MALDYSSLDDCAFFVEEKLGVAEGDLETLIEVTAGTKDGMPYGRPYYVAALLLGRQAHDDVLTKAKGGVTFGDPERTIKGWLSLQASLDRALGLTVPAGFEAVVEIVNQSPSSAVPMVVLL